MEKPFALLVEDDRDVAALFRHVLDMAGYHTEVILDGREAMDRLNSSTPDIVLLDLQLPNMSGVEILKQMRDDERMKNIPVVVVTAYGHYSESLPVEPDLFLLKPVDINDMSSLIQRLRATKDSMQDSPLDKTTSLYTISFFTVRLIFAMERIKQMEAENFGVLFAELHPYEKLKERFEGEYLENFLREAAAQFKSTLRPTDTMAWSEEGFFLALFENMVTKDVLEMIAERVRKKLSGFFRGQESASGIEAKVGVILCDEGYVNVQDILDDIDFGRSVVTSEKDDKAVYFNQQELQKLRGE